VKLIENSYKPHIQNQHGIETNLPVVICPIHSLYSIINHSLFVPSPFTVQHYSVLCLCCPAKQNPSFGRCRSHPWMLVRQMLIQLRSNRTRRKIGVVTFGIASISRLRSGILYSSLTSHCSPLVAWVRCLKPFLPSPSFARHNSL